MQGLDWTITTEHTRHKRTVRYSPDNGFATDWQKFTYTCSGRAPRRAHARPVLPDLCVHVCDDPMIPWPTLINVVQY